MSTIKTTIKLESDCQVLGVFLHQPGEISPDPLPGVSHTVKRDLEPGPYAVSASGTGNQPGRKVTVTISTSVNAKTATQLAEDDGSMIGWFPFHIDEQGNVS